MTAVKNIHKLNNVDNNRIQNYVSSLYDFATGEFKGEHAEIRKDSEFWAQHMIRSRCVGGLHELGPKPLA